MMGRPLLFALNGEKVELTEVDPRTTVLQYIRSQTSLQGTKLSCGEGGCGACTVLLSKYDAETKRVEELTINSCLAPLCSIDRCAITTTEGLRTGPKHDFHSVHKRIAGFHGSQCGFCTPGMSMSIYGGLRKAAAKSGDRGSFGNGMSECKGHPKYSTAPGLTALDAAKCISGNICRCTGYRPILDACKSFSGDVDVEDLGLNAFWSSKAEADAAYLPPYDAKDDPKFPSFLIKAIEARENSDHPQLESTQNRLSFNHVEGNEVTEEHLWITAASLPEVFSLLEHYNNLKLEIKLVVGNTSAGVYKDIRPQVYLDICQIPELREVRIGVDGIEVGAGVSLTRFIDLLEAQTESVVFGELAKHVRKIASEQVRNRASLGGNLILSKKFGFESDLATILLGVDTEVTLASSAGGRSTLPLEEFLAEPGLESGAVLVSVWIPSWTELRKTAEKTGARLLFKTYRVSCRPDGNAVSYVNAALLAIFDVENACRVQGGCSTNMVRDLRLAFGAFGGPHAIRAHNTENLMVGKCLSPSVLLAAVEELRNEVKPPPTVHKSAYRSSVAVGFLFDFFNASLFAPSTAISDHSPAYLPEEKDEAPQMPKENDHASGATNGAVLSIGTPKGPKEFEYGTKKPIFSGKQTSVQSSAQKFAASTEFWPVAQPTKKYAVELQASGEAVYVDDIPPVKGTLYATIVLSDEKVGKLVTIDTADALRSPGAVDFISAKDVLGENWSYCMWSFKDRLFVEDRVECPHDTLGIMVADSHEHARYAASKVKTTVEEEAGIYTIEDAIASESYGDWGMFAFAASSSFGELPIKSDHRIENAEVFAGSQYCFYMETQTAYAVPDEDGCITVYSSNQSPNSVQAAIAACLGIPMNCVRVIVRRVGGGFGGKVTKASTIAVSCAIAAYKLKRPVKMYLDRQTDMRMCAGRHDVKAIYSVDFNDDGNVTGLEAKVFLDSGRAKDVSPVCVTGLNEGLKQYDWGSLKIENSLCKTSRINRTIVRGPGTVQGHFIAETVIEHVAAYLGMNAYEVREKNMHNLDSLSKFFPMSISPSVAFTIPHIWQKLKDTSQFEQRLLAVQTFNEGSQWVKKGIDIVVGLYSTGAMARDARVSIFDDGSVVVEVAGVEMGQGLWTKVKQAVAYGLSKLWGPDAHPSERVDMSMIRIVQNDSISLPNSEPSGGSTASEGSCQAALLACEELVQSFEPFLQKLREIGRTPASWDAIVGMAKNGGASLSAQGKMVSNASMTYVNYGACVSEVAIDLLTGSTTILQTDLLYDCGRSLNPAVDIGQVEGAFVMGIGFYLTEEWHDEKGKVLSDSTWSYKPPTLDNIPKRFYIELSNTKANKERILSSKSSGEPPFLLAKSVHSAVRHAVTAAREDLRHLPRHGEEENGNHAGTVETKGNRYFRLDTPVSADKVKALCGLYNVEKYLASFQYSS